VFIQRLYVMICVRKCLRYSMVCDGNGRMSPVMGTFYDIFYFRYAIHIAHLRMAVELCPFQRAEILSGYRKITNLLYPRDGTDRQLSVKFVDGGHAFDLDECPFFQLP